MLQCRKVYLQRVHDNTTGPPTKQNENYQFFEDIKCFPECTSFLQKGNIKEFFSG